MSPCYLDIETDFSQKITIIGLYKPGIGTEQLIAPEITAESLKEALQDVNTVFTYNGARFDLPIINSELRVDMTKTIFHRDLMYDCWSHKLRGGLKRVEQILGIHRDTQGLNGIDAMKLWDAYFFRGNEEALETLLLYNREDVENLEILARKLGVISEGFDER